MENQFDADTTRGQESEKAVRPDVPQSEAGGGRAPRRWRAPLLQCRTAERPSRRNLHQMLKALGT